jgi:hypothetical protein
MVAVPINEYGEGRASLSDGCTELTPLSNEKLKALYGEKIAYVRQYSVAAWTLVQNGFLLPRMQ